MSTDARRTDARHPDARHPSVQPSRSRILGLAPMVLFSVSAMVTLDSVATVAASGWRGIAVFTILAVVFYAPYGFITAELGSAWPQEGGMYVWIREAYGERVGGVCAWFYWVNLAYWAPAVFVIFAGTVRTAFWPSMSRTWEELIVIGLLWLVVAVGILPLRLTTWVNNASAAAKMTVLIAAAVVGLVYAAQHGLANPVTTSQLWPGTGIGLAAVAVILSNFCGWEVMSSLGGHVKDPRRDIPRMILIAGIAIVGTQILGMAGILAALPLQDLSIVSGIADAMDLSFRLVLGSGAAASAAYDAVIVLLLFTFVGTMVTWSTGANHSINVTGLDRSAPRVFGHLNRRFGTPDYAFVLMAALATVLTVLNYALFGGNEQIFWTIFSLSSVAFMAPYTLMFPALLVLRRKFPDVARPFRVPGGRVGAWLAVILAETFVTLGLILFLTVIPTGQSRVTYTAIVAGGGVATLLVGIWLSRRRAPATATSGTGADGA